MASPEAQGLNPSPLQIEREIEAQIMADSKPPPAAAPTAKPLSDAKPLVAPISRDLNDALTTATSVSDDSKMGLGSLAVVPAKGSQLTTASREEIKKPVGLNLEEQKRLARERGECRPCVCGLASVKFGSRVKLVLKLTSPCTTTGRLKALQKSAAAPPLAASISEKLTFSALHGESASTLPQDSRRIVSWFGIDSTACDSELWTARSSECEGGAYRRASRT